MRRSPCVVGGGSRSMAGCRRLHRAPHEVDLRAAQRRCRHVRRPLDASAAAAAAVASTFAASATAATSAAVAAAVAAARDSHVERERAAPPRLVRVRHIHSHRTLADRGAAAPHRHAKQQRRASGEEIELRWLAATCITTVALAERRCSVHERGPFRRRHERLGVHPQTCACRGTRQQRDFEHELPSAGWLSREPMVLAPLSSASGDDVAPPPDGGAAHAKVVPGGPKRCAQQRVVVAGQPRSRIIERMVANYTPPRRGSTEPSGRHVTV